jgi:hypothetical protein
MRFLIIPVLLVVLFSCKKESTVSEITEAEESKIRAIGQKATTELLNTLQKKLKSTIQNHGMMRAINVCNIEALSLTDSIQQATDDILEIKRTSLRYRNPANAPDANERNALSYFQKTFLQSGNLPNDLIEKTIDGSSIEYHYYKPLTMKPLCLSCHGKTERVDPDLFHQIKKLYPRDKATGYSVNQFRGLVHITIR